MSHSESRGASTRLVGAFNAELDKRLELTSAAVKIRPLSNRIIIQRIEETKSSGGLIHLPENRDRDAAPLRARVIAVGPGKLLKDGVTREPIGCRPGDVVLAGAYSGHSFEYGGQKYQMVDTDDVVAVVG